MAFVAGNFVAGSILASWTPLRSSSTPNITTWYHASTKKMIDYNSLTDVGTTVATGSPRRSAIAAAFGAPILAANQRVANPPTIPTAVIPNTGTGASAIPVSPSSSGSSSSGSPRNFGLKYAVYPEDMGATKMDRIMFEMRKAGARTGQFSGSSSSGLTGFGPLPTGESLGSVFLGIQGAISDSNSVDWSGATMNPLQAALAESAIKAMGEGKNVAKMIGELANNVMNKAKKAIGSGDSRSNLQILLAQEAVQAQGLLSRLKGQVANPNLELLFNGPQLRTFSFNFRMVSRSTTEAANVKKIIRFFKQGMAMQTRTDTDIFLKSPNVFDIQYQSGEDGKAHRSLPQIKRSALIRCDVNYVPDGSYMTFADATQGFPMTCYDLSLGFSEISPLTAGDYDTSDDIGF